MYSIRKLSCLYGIFVNNNKKKCEIFKKYLHFLINNKTFIGYDIKENGLYKMPALAIYGSSCLNVNEIVDFIKKNGTNESLIYFIGIYTLIVTGNYYKAWINAYTLSNDYNKQVLKDSKMLEGINPIQRVFYRLFYSHDIDEPISGALVGTIYPPLDEQVLIDIHKNKKNNIWINTITNLIKNNFGN